MLHCCPETLLQRACASGAGVCICGVGPPSATSEVHSGDSAMMVSLPHPSLLQPHVKVLCPGGSAPARKPVVQENVRQSLQDVQNHERSCGRKAHCRSAGTQKLQLQGAQIPTSLPPLENRSVPAFLLPIGIPTVELCPYRCSISRDSTCLQIGTDRLDGSTCLVTIRISDLKKKNLFLT